MRFCDTAIIGKNWVVCAILLLGLGASAGLSQTIPTAKLPKPDSAGWIRIFRGDNKSDFPCTRAMVAGRGGLHAAFRRNLHHPGRGHHPHHGKTQRAADLQAGFLPLHHGSAASLAREAGFPPASNAREIPTRVSARFGAWGPATHDRGSPSRTNRIRTAPSTTAPRATMPTPWSSPSPKAWSRCNPKAEKSGTGAGASSCCRKIPCMRRYTAP